MKTRTAFVLVLMCFAGCQNQRRPAPAVQDLVFNYNVIQGSASSEQESALNNAVVQRLLLDIAAQPRPEEYVAAALRKTGISPKDLARADLKRQKDGMYVINFLLFPESDSRRIHEITEAHAQMLADGLLKRRGEIDSIVSQYNVPGVDRRAALYCMLGCFSLDWDGLALTAQRGYRESHSWFSRIFPRTVIYGWQPGEPSKRGIYCGSHNTTYGDATLTSFGDHEIQPRRTLPDVLWGINGYPDTLKTRVAEVTRASSVDGAGEQIGKWMLTLRGGSQSFAGLAAATGAENEKAGKLGELLVTLGYISRNGDTCSARIPVLSPGDSSMVRRIRAIGREEMEQLP